MAVSNSLSRYRGFTLRTKPFSRRQAGALVRKVGSVPAQGIGEQARHFVIQIVPCGQGVESAADGFPVENVAFDLAADRTDRAFYPSLDFRDGQAFGSQFDYLQRQFMGGAKGFDLGSGLAGGFLDAQVDMQARDIVPLQLEFEHQRQGVLAA